METKNYRGKVTGVATLRTNAFGDRTYEVQFTTGKAIYKISSHQKLSFSPGDTITFKCRKISVDAFEFFHITEVVDINDIELFLSEDKNRIAVKV
jgi:hypothetical protein